jgi:hypothetical protein
MEPVGNTRLSDCPWCGSAKSIEHGLCQVCLNEFGADTKVIRLDLRRTPLQPPAAIELPAPGGLAGGAD